MIPKLMAAVLKRLRPAVVDLLHLGYGAARRRDLYRRSATLAAALGERALYVMALWLGYNAGIVPLLRLHADRRRPPHEVAMLAADHLLYGLVIGRLCGRPI